MNAGTNNEMDEALVDRKVDETNEQFDEEGNPIRVGNLEFVEGILGTGAYGTVRLARRHLPPRPPRDGLGSEPTSPERICPSTETFASPQRGGKSFARRRHRVRNSRSVSAPLTTTSDFFRSEDAASSSSSSKNNNVNSSHHDCSDHGNNGQDNDHPILVGPLELIVPRVVRKASSTLGSFFEDEHNKKTTIEPELVAVKIFSKSILKRMRTMERDSKTHRVQVRTALEKVEREIALMKKMSHPNLVALHEVIDSPESDMLYMVLEYMPLGEIMTYQNDGTFCRKPPGPNQKALEGVVQGHFDEAHAALYFVDILHALAYLHQHHICHRDLKPENILLDARGIVKISDFGVSHFFEEEHNIGAHRVSNTTTSTTSTVTESLNNGTADYPFKRTNHLTRSDTDSALAMTGMADAGRLTKTEGTWCFWSPEMCGASKEAAFSGYAADMWAAGVCLYIFVTGRLPFYSDVPTDLFDAIAEADVPYKGLGLSNSLLDLLKATLEKDPNKRAGVGDCLKHPFLQVARAKRFRQLSSELERSGRLKLVVGEEDIRRAFRIVTMPNPAVLLKSAQKTLKEGFQAARERLSMSSMYSSQSSFDKAEEQSSRAVPQKQKRKKDTNQRVGSMSSQCSSQFSFDNYSSGDEPSSNRPVPPKNQDTGTEERSPARPVLMKNRSTMSLESNSSTNSDSPLPMKLFPIPQNRKITESTKDIVGVFESDRISNADDVEDSERSATALIKSSQTSVSTKSTDKSPARKSKAGWKRRKSGNCAIQ